MQVSEVNKLNLEVPENKTHLIGDYSVTIDTARAEQGGDYLSGWLVVSDDAGNLMDGGTFFEPLFNVMISDDGSPRVSITADGMGHRFRDLDSPIRHFEFDNTDL